MFFILRIMHSISLKLIFQSAWGNNKQKMLPSIVKNIENIYSYTSTLHAVDMSLRSKYLYLRTAGERRIETCLGIMFIVDNGRPSL